MEFLVCQDSAPLWSSSILFVEVSDQAYVRGSGLKVSAVGEYGEVWRYGNGEIAIKGHRATFVIYSKVHVAELLQTTVLYKYLVYGGL